MRIYIGTPEFGATVEFIFYEIVSAIVGIVSDE
jgi:hypothetical protein